MSTAFDLDQRSLDAASRDLLFNEAHTTYRFSSTPVDDQTLAEIYERTRWAPTMMNAQPLRIVYVRTEAGKARLLPLLNEGNRAKSQSAPVVAILAADTDFHEHLPRVAPASPGAKDRFSDEVARERVARNNAHLQAGYFILAVRSVGLDAGPMGGFDAAGVDAEFFAGTGLKSFLVVNIGHSAEDGQFPRQPRLELDEAVTLL